MTTPYATGEQRWQAVKNRDKHAAGIFYYAVKTTGIYCLPGCASRCPKRENVAYYDTTEAAETAGFRPCKRCRPNDPAHSGIASNRILNACRAIETAEQPPSLDTLAATANLSPHHFQRLFKEHVGVSPKIYAQAVRDTKVRAALKNGHSVTRAIFDAGYGSSSRFYEKSTTVLGMPAKTYKKGGTGLTIYHAYAHSFLGPILAAFTENGVCSIEFGDNEPDLIQALITRFPQATITAAGPELHHHLAEIIDFIKTPEKGLSLPLDIQGTAFQQRVWKELQNIPAGQIRTYSQVAQALGIPNSVRAVASACAKNRLAVIIPCHRVLRKGGGLGGYYWGLQRKEALLKNEQDENEKQ